jgi:HEAT repeat protein
MHYQDLPHLRAALVCMGPAAGEQMVRISGYGWRIREPAFAAALQIGGQAVIDEAIRQVQSEDSYGRRGGAKVLTELRPLSGILPLMRALDNNRFQDAEVDRALAAYDSRAVPYLRKAWEDKTLGKGTRLAAAILLVHHGDDVGMSALADTVANGEKLLMNAVVGRMYYTRDPRMLPLIAKALERKDAQQSITYAAAACGGKDALPMLRKALTHPDVGVRYGAQVWVEKLSKAPEASSEEDAERWKTP